MIMFDEIGLKNEVYLAKVFFFKKKAFWFVNDLCVFLLDVNLEINFGSLPSRKFCQETLKKAEAEAEGSPVALGSGTSQPSTQQPLRGAGGDGSVSSRGRHHGNGVSNSLFIAKRLAFTALNRCKEVFAFL